MKRCLPLLLILCFVKSEAQNRRDLAVFFPVTDYKPGSGWTDLLQTLPECTNIAADLENYYGFKTELLPEYTAIQIIDKLVELAARKYGPKDQLLLFFSMHGHFEEAARGGSLAPAGGTSDPRTWLLHSQLDYYVSRIPCPHILVALDACYSGTFGGSRAIPNGVPGADCADKIANALQNQSCLYLAAGGKEKVPADSDFARRWRSALGSRGGDDGILSFLELQLRLSEATPTPKWGTFGNDLGGSFVFVTKNACSGAGTMPTRDPDQAAIENARRQNTEEGWQFYWDNWPRGRFRSEAGQALDRFQEDRVWRAAENAKTPLAYNNYKNIYCPGGRYCADVEERLKARPDNMIRIMGGSFQMGSNDGEGDEIPVRPVTLSDFYIGKYEVTVAEFRRFIEATDYLTDAEKDGGSYGYEGTEWKKIEGLNWRHDPDGNAARDMHPVINVSWNDAVKYCEWLGPQYRLPTEAEWEYAAGNGARQTKYSWGNGDPAGKKGGSVADETGAARFNWEKTAANIFLGYTDHYATTAPVGSFEANDFGLFDMSGNVWEWCSDWFGTYPASSQTNPTGPTSGSVRVVRGGSWGGSPQYCRAADRGGYAPGDRNYNVGFRLARTK
jgi:formylglycine-generating enzyme required for sulfatase activity